VEDVPVTSAHHLRRRVGIVVAAMAIAAFGAGSAALGARIKPVDNIHNVLNAPTPVSNAVFGTDNSYKSGQRLCTTAFDADALNVNTDCDDGSVGPHNETSIAVNPTDHDNMIGGANDYQLALNPGGQVSQTVLSRAHVTTDGGNTWKMYPILFNSTYQATGDPAVAFDASGHAYYATLGFRFVGLANAQNPDILVANSGDKGVHWKSVRVAAGSGNFGSVGHLLDKEYITAWGHGNALVTWGDFRLGPGGSYISARIYSSVTHDYGATWSAPQLISGSLHDAFVSVPAVRPGVESPSAVYVAFMNTDDFATTGCADAGDCRDTYYVVKLDPSTGARIGGPTAVGLVYDGVGDYPLALGRQTYQDSAFRSWAAGNIAVDPANGNHVAVVWSDLRNGLATDSNPYETTTDSDVIVSESTDGGAHWSAPDAIVLSGDQFQPWGAFDWNSDLRIGTFDRGVDTDNHKYGYTVLNYTGGGSSSASDFDSDPTKDTRWFSGTTLDPDFPHPTAFLGDYANIAVVPGTDNVAAYWTDLRNNICFGGRCGTGQDAFFSLLP
jgi:hypothetical protein